MALRTICSSALLFVVVVAALGAGTTSAELYKISNKVLTIGIDTDLGGAISWLSDNNVPHKNLINCHDEGREVQQSYYGGPNKMCTWNGQPWPWNPISAGDQYGHKSQVLNVVRSSASLYAKVRPLMWACDNVLCDCFFETWVSFPAGAPPNTVVVKNRLTMFRNDTTAYGAHDQELPAVYTIGAFADLFVSRADGSYEQATYPVPGPPWGNFADVTGNWMAAAMPASENAGRYAVGVFNNATTTFLGGFHGSPSAGATSRDDATMYMAPIAPWTLPHNATKTWCFALGLGYLADFPSTFGYFRENGVPC